MNIALILAGGSGNRMEAEVPKQFILIYEKPIIIYTLEAFQAHPEIDKIVVVCRDGWQATLTAYSKKFNINKLIKVVTGGETGQESIRNGIFELNDVCKDNDMIIIHDGVRPLVDENVLTDVIVTSRKYGNAISSMPCYEQFFKLKDSISTEEYIKRETLRLVYTPQAYRFSKLFWAYTKAFDENIGLFGSSYVNTLMADLGERLYFSLGSYRNIKLTTKDDIELFKAFLRAKSEQLD